MWRPPDFAFVLRNILNTMRTWLAMLHRAGVRLLDYGLKESKTWATLGLHNTAISGTSSDENITLRRLMYGATPEDWTLMVSKCWNILVYKLCPTPGSYPSTDPVPTTITWKPRYGRERTEGQWELVRTIRRYNEPVELELLLKAEELLNAPEEITELIEGTQDDSGVIMAMQYQAAHSNKLAPRSYSQPPPMRRCSGGASHTSSWLDRPPWLESYHLCPFNSRWRFDCYASEHFDDLWTCIEGVSSECFSVQESSSWRWRSFLRQIAQCQDGSPEPYSPCQSSALMRHTGTRNCTQGCSRIYLDRLNVPERLQEYHPVPRVRDFAEIENDDL